jgi:type III restriction enzyme
MMPSDQATKTSWIQKTPGVCGGEACIRNTRHTVAGLVQWRGLGLSDERILAHHPDLIEADLEAAWSYYCQHPQEIDEAIRDDEES